MKSVASVFGRAIRAWVVFVDRLSGKSFIEVSDVSGRLKGRLP